jgi:hypothetical protein
MQIDSPPRNGACFGKPVSWFFPDTRTVGITKNARMALNICAECSVKQECAEYALKWELHGIWGGLTERQRKVIRNERGIMLETPGYQDPSLMRIRP